jgi:acyl carrier protein
MKFELNVSDVKRLYYNGNLKTKCPKCQAIIERDGGFDNLEYPIVGETLVFWCDNCDHEWEAYKIKSMYIEFEKIEKPPEVIDEVLNNVIDNISDLYSTYSSPIENILERDDVHLLIDSIDLEDIMMELEDRYSELDFSDFEKEKIDAIFRGSVNDIALNVYRLFKIAP